MSKSPVLGAVTGTAAIAVLTCTAPAQDLKAVLDDGKPILDVRLRYEFVDQDGFAQTANAATLRTRLGFETGEWAGFRVLLEAENITDLSDDGFNSTTNGQSQFPVVADPEATEINRALVSYTAIPNTDVVLGRQRIILNNSRFVGNVGFRQNEQTFDAVSISHKPVEPVELTYIYIDRVHRVFGDENPAGEFNSNSHVVQADITTPIGDLSAYGLLFDFDDAPAASTNTLGARLTGPLATLGQITTRYTAEYAHQTDAADNANEFDLSYASALLTAQRNHWSAGFGVEWLEGDGAVGFSTPLGTLHAFQGAADVFLTTPAQGVRDLYVQGGTTLPKSPIGRGAKLFVRYHDFTSDDGDLDFGSELNTVFDMKLTELVDFQAKAAIYDGGDDGFADRTKVWVALQLRY